MVPTPMLPVESAAEGQLYNALRDQLSDNFVCYHGITWLALGRRPTEGEADFLIAHPDHGVLVLEVKGGQLTYDPTRRVWRRQGQSGVVQDPFDQARKCMHWLVDELKRQPQLASGLPSYGYGVAFPNGEYLEQAHPNAPLDLTVDRRDMDALARRIPKLMERWNGGNGRPFGDRGMRALNEALGYRVNVLVPFGARIEDAQRHLADLTPEQAYVLDMLRRSPRAAVSGAAGSGKTLLAIEIAKHHARAGKRTLVTCFNKRLAAYLTEASVDVPGITVSHFHELAYTVGLATGQVTEQDASRPTTDNDPFFTEELPAALTRAAGDFQDRFEVIVVDEAQDLREAYWDALLRLHASPADGPLYVFADDNQNIYRGAALPLAEDEFLPPLRTNLRNSREIQEFLAALYKERGGDRQLDVGGESLGPVRIIPYESDQDAIAAVTEVVTQLLERENVRLEDIALLTPWSDQKSSVRRGSKLGALPLSPTPVGGRLLSSSLQGFKGLERPVVILAEIGERGDSHLVEHLYIGGSRAQMLLIVVAKREIAGTLAQLPGATS